MESTGFGTQVRTIKDLRIWDKRPRPSEKPTAEGNFRVKNKL